VALAREREEREEAPASRRRADANSRVIARDKEGEEIRNRLWYVTRPPSLHLLLEGLLAL